MLFLPREIWNLILLKCVSQASSNIEESILTLAQLRRTCKLFKSIIDSENFRFLYIIRISHLVHYSPLSNERFEPNRQDSFSSRLLNSTEIVDSSASSNNIACYHVYINKQTTRGKLKCIENWITRKEEGIHKLFCQESKIKNPSIPYCCKGCSFGLSYKKAAALAKYAIKSPIAKKEKNKKKKNGLVK